MEKVHLREVERWWENKKRLRMIILRFWEYQADHKCTPGAFEKAYLNRI
jgi:hypothetical protein